MFVKLCDEDDIWEGGTTMGAVNGHRILIVWPEGGQPCAFLGICPHRGTPLDGASLDGNALICAQHLWSFDCATGESIDPPGCSLPRYDMKIENGAVWVDIE